MSSHILNIKNFLNKYPEPLITIKPDGSPVTELDLALSQLVEDVSTKHFSDCCFYSEEKFSEWKFPLLALDPLDGTREYIEKRPEWAISMGLFENENFEGEGWMLNPVTDELFTMETVTEKSRDGILRGEASRSEFKQGLYEKAFPENIILTPRGSIAYKLGKLSHGKLDYCVSLRPKNIWDIAGGTLLCKKAGFEFYSGGKIVTKVLKSYEPPLLWCRPSDFEVLSKHFS